MTDVRTKAGQTLLANEGVLPLFIGAMAEDDHVLLDYVLTIEAEARRDAFAAIEAAVTERMHGGVWLSEAAMLDLVKNAREAAPTDD